MKAVVSIITVTRNNANGLRRTLRSVAALKACEHAEVIVIDGHSTDETDSVVREFSDWMPIYEKDSGAGIYAAMNQGVEKASGDYVIFMNAGDCFFDADVVQAIVPCLEGDLVFGRAFHEDGSEQFPYVGLERVWARMPFGHQAVFIRTALMRERPYDLDFRIAADFDFILWALNTGKTLQRTEVPVARIEAGGVSATRLLARVRETYRAARRYYKTPKMHLFYWRKLKWAIVAQRNYS